MSENFLLGFKGSYTIVPVIIILSLGLLYIDSKISGKELKLNEYLKIATASAFISFIVVYINTLKGVVSEEILTGSPPF